MNRVVLATQNPGKIEELRRILAEADGEIELIGLDKYPEIGDIPETGLTFADNALIKARAVVEATGLPAVADDSGLCVDALNGMPGVLSARWSGRHGDDAANLALLLAQISDIPAPHRGAHFTCAAALVLPTGEEKVVEGILNGEIIHTPRGTGGFGYDPIFLPEGETRTTAEMPPAAKDATSHRGRAFRELAPHIRTLLAP